MKKSLFAIAAVTAFAGAAQAQSSVTVYGIMDVGFAGSTNRAPAALTANQQLKSNQTGFTGVGSQTTSRLGFRGTEDLGGGMSAFFTMEVALTPTDASASGSYADRGVTTSTNWFVNRQSFVGLAQKGVGRAAIGNQYTPVHLAIAATDPGQQNNMKGNVIYAPIATQGSGETASSYTVRFNQALTLQTENIAGFRGYAIFGQNNTNRTQLSPAYTADTSATAGGGNNNSGAWGLGINYTYKKFLATVNYQSINTENNGARFIPANATDPTVATVTATGLKDNQYYVAAMYDFGILKAYAQYLNRKATSQADQNIYLSRSAQQLGVRGNWTPKIESWASIGNGRYRAFGDSEPTANFNGWQLGTNYILSKRTNLYGIYGQTQTASTSSGLSMGGSSYGVGVRHTF